MIPMAKDEKVEEKAAGDKKADDNKTDDAGTKANEATTN